MDATCTIQDSIHVFSLVHNMCPGFWVHIIYGVFFSYVCYLRPRLFLCFLNRDGTVGAYLLFFENMAHKCRHIIVAMPHITTLSFTNETHLICWVKHLLHIFNNGNHVRKTWRPVVDDFFQVRGWSR